MGSLRDTYFGLMSEHPQEPGESDDDYCLRIVLADTKLALAKRRGNVEANRIASSYSVHHYSVEVKGRPWFGGGQPLRVKSSDLEAFAKAEGISVDDLRRLDTHQVLELKGKSGRLRLPSGGRHDLRVAAGEVRVDVDPMAKEPKGIRVRQPERPLEALPEATWTPAK